MFKFFEDVFEKDFLFKTISKREKHFIFLKKSHERPIAKTRY